MSDEQHKSRSAAWPTKWDQVFGKIEQDGMTVHVKWVDSGSANLAVNVRRSTQTSYLEAKDFNALAEMLGRTILACIVARKG